jgi:Tfp pilus assembly protein PilF
MSSSVRLASVVLVSTLSIFATAQRTSSGGRTGGTSTPSSTNNSTRQPTFGVPNTPTQRQVIYLSGTVLQPDGTPPPESVAIERVCNGQARKEGYTDSKGRFQIQLGQTYELQDVSETGDISGMGGMGGSRSAMGGSTGVDTRSLLSCELRALLPGFRSSSVMIRPEGSFGEVQVGTIILERLGGKAEGTTISLTTMQAPGNARKEYEKAQKLLGKEDLKGAEKNLTKAIEIYPRFAAAWALLGTVHQSFNQLDEASKDYQQSINADPQYVNPYFGMAQIAARQQKWQDTLRLSDQVTKLDPLAFPDIYFFNAVASYNLTKFDQSEKNARKFLSLDTEHRRPMAALLLAELLSRKQDYAGAAQQAQNYLAMAPNAPDAEQVRAKLKKLQEMSTTSQESAQNGAAPQNATPPTRK